MENDLREGAIQLGTGAYIFTIQVYVLPDGITYEGEDAAEDGEEAEETSIDSQAILVLEKTTDPVSIVSGSNKIRFGTLNEASGNGTLSLTVKFPDEGVQSVTVDLTPQDEGNTHSVSNKSLAISEPSGGYRSVVFDDNPSNGWYIVKFNFTINNGVRDTNQVWSELVQIATGRQTKKDDIVIENLNTLYPITYNCKGGRLKGDSISLSYTPYQGAIPMPEVADRNVATFAGWYSDPDYQNKVTQIPAGSKGAKTFYAKWKYNIEEGKLYASGEKLIVKKDSDSDTIVRAYFDEVNPDNAVLNDDGRLLNIYSWKVYGSKKDGTYPEGTTDDITVESGS
ncbi:MAG: InlB B-repeat-containing protein, partial [Treponema sp.]|nr:InlB B-repeat-containing protein [Treponema sp.]